MAKKSASSKNLDDLARMFMSILRFASNTEKACKMLKPKKSKKTYSKPRNSFPHYIHIAGTTYLEDSSVLDQLKIGDELLLERESSNPYDSNAVLILNQYHQKIGYIPKKNNTLLAFLMDRKEKYKAKIVEFEYSDNFRKIIIEIEKVA